MVFVVGVGIKRISNFFEVHTGTPWSTSQTETKSTKAEPIRESVYEMYGVMVAEQKVDLL